MKPLLRALLALTVIAVVTSCSNPDEGASETTADAPATTATSTPTTSPPTTEAEITDSEWSTYCAAIEAERDIIYDWNIELEGDISLEQAAAARRIQEAAPTADSRTWGNQYQLWGDMADGYEAFAAVDAGEDTQAIRDDLLSGSQASTRLRRPLSSHCDLPQP